MVRIPRKEMNGKSMAVGIGGGTIVAVILSLLLAALAAVLIAQEKINEDQVNIFSLGIQYTAALLGAMCAYGMVRSKCMLVTGITSLGYLLLLCMAAIVFYDGISASFWTNILAVGLAFLSACTVCISRGGKRPKRKRASR